MIEGEEIPLGFCQCGCGGKTSIPLATDRKLNRVKGRPMRFIAGHNGKFQKPGRLSIEQFRERLLEKPETGCLLWTGATNSRGYGQLRVDGRTEEAHRYAWMLAGLDIPTDKPCVLHNCPGGDNPRCCNTDHLWVGTKRENNIDRSAKGRNGRNKTGLPPGVTQRPSGRFQAYVVLGGGKMKTVGTFDSWQEAAAMALFHKNLHLYPDLSVN